MMRSISPSFVKAHLPKRKKDATKSDAGRVLILAGSRGMRGAAALCAMGALEGGAGLLVVATPGQEKLLSALRLPHEAMTAFLSFDKDGSVTKKSWGPLATKIKNFRPDVVALGPGLGGSPAVRFLVMKLLRTSTVPLVIDADAINALSVRDFPMKGSAPFIMTPHEGELARFLGVSTRAVQENRIQMARAAAKKNGGVCVLKGPKTVVATATKVFINTTGNERMASGGMGDVLTGLLAALVAACKGQGLESIFTAARIGVFLHGRAGDIESRKKGGFSVLASDVARAIPAALNSIKTGDIKC